MLASAVGTSLIIIMMSKKTVANYSNMEDAVGTITILKGVQIARKHAKVIISLLFSYGRSFNCCGYILCRREVDYSRPGVFLGSGALI